MTEQRADTTYASAGVDIDAGERAVDLMKASVAKASRPEVLGGLGGFAGLFDASALRGMRRPVLATSTDGVGTKIEIARRLDRHDTIGFDLVGMVVDDLVVCGAEPLFMTDYIACGRVHPERIATIVGGIAAACEVAGCALIGGETAEHPGLLEPDEYDLAGAATGVVEADALLGPDRVRVGDVAIALASSGLHSNGFSLVRHVLATAGRPSLDQHIDELGRTLGEELLEPTTVYARDCLALIGGAEVHAMAHITGGGVAANVARVLPADVDLQLDRASWSPQPIFDVIGSAGAIGRDAREGTFNMGIGMLAIVEPDSADAALEVLAACGVRAWVAGTVRAGSGIASLAGSYA